MNRENDNIPMESTIAVVPIYQPQPIIIGPQHTRVSLSCGLIGCGIVQFLLSATSIGLSAWLMNLANFPIFANISLGCGVFFCVMSLLAMHGGNDVKRRQYEIIWCMVFGMLGVLTGLAAIAFNLMALAAYPEECSACKVKVDLSVTNFGIEAKCSAMCYIAYVPAHLSLVILAGIEAVIGLILSIAACCNVCRCCCCYPSDYDAGGMIIQAPPSQYVGHQFVNPSSPYAYSRIEA